MRVSRIWPSCVIQRNQASPGTRSCLRNTPNGALVNEIWTISRMAASPMSVVVSVMGSSPSVPCPAGVYRW